MRISGRLEQFNSFDGKQKMTLIYTPPTTFVVSPLGSVVEDLAKQVHEVARTLKSTLVVQQLERQEPTEEEIRERAHKLWANREQLGVPGSPMSDWLNARRALLNERRDG